MKWNQLWQADVSQLSDLQRMVEKITQQIAAPTIVLLQGPMGVGKTETVRRLVGSLHGPKASLATTSPTFAFHHHYQGPPTIEHWDLFRVKGEEDLDSTGFWDQFQNPLGWILIEWPENLKQEWLPDSWPLYKIELRLNQLRRDLIFSKAELS